jgi:murein DD-endopeptidase MepM/ murein hydrolase activator NlpD
VQNPLTIMKIRPLQFGRYDPLSNTFGMVRKHRPHQGWDLLAVPGTRVFAIADGELTVGPRSASYGNWLSLKFTYKSRTLFAFYAHLQNILQSNVSVTEGSLDRTYGPHRLGRPPPSN